jgi:hypothetical protein
VIFRLWQEPNGPHNPYAQQTTGPAKTGGFQQGKVVTDSSGRYDKDGSATGNSLITATARR